VMLLPEKVVQKISYGELFSSVLEINPHHANLNELKQCVARHVEIDMSTLTATDCLDILFSHCIEPTLQGITFVYNYPSSQAALAKITKDEQGNIVARRFEVFVDGMELANGYCELTDAQEQRGRFEQDIKARQLQNKKIYPVDEALLRALEKGLPECAGVAMGIDRLLIKLIDTNHISSVIPLFWE
jgi:elongation factor P--(R)-beta-lysine ligase